MKETGIIMSGNHPKLILEGTKIMTRRVIKPQPSLEPTSHDYATAGKYLRGNALFYDDRGVSNLVKCPYGQVGDRLWVRETWRLEMNSGCWDVGYKNTVWKKDVGTNPYMIGYRHLKDKTWVWRPSIFMPRWASRITLEITEVRVERIKEISRDDIVAEGLPRDIYSYQNRFMNLWDSLNAKRGFGWEVNPWVGVISFKEV